MKTNDIMAKSPILGMFLAIVLVSSLALFTLPYASAAENIDAKSIAFEETTIIEFTNESNIPVNTFRIWLGSDFDFKSFKTEKGWTGEKTPQGVIIFTSSEDVEFGDSVKFGIKTNKEKPGINWKALDNKENEIDIGKALAGELKPVDTPDETPSNTDGILADSTFRIIPERPNVGSTIRVTGSNFAPVQEFSFYIDDKKLDSFVTNDAGSFMMTTKIPEKIESDRVNFLVKDSSGNERKISLRLGEGKDRVTTENVKLTIKGISPMIYRGESLEISGTAQPTTAVTVKISNPDGNVITSHSAEVNSKGNWELSKPIVVPSDAPLGDYKAEITDGKQTKLLTYTVDTDKTIIISPTKTKFELGDILSFNGTAKPNIPIELSLKDPRGKEIYSDIIQVGEDGKVLFEYQTDNNSIKGTYSVTAKQETEQEFSYGGLGVRPEVPVNISFDRLNYKNTETANIVLSGKSSEVVSLLIIDPSDNPKGTAESIKIGPEGTANFELDLKGYSSGVYTAVASKGNAKSSATFTVGLQIGSGAIDINTTKIDYEPGDSVLILGKTSANVLLKVQLIDPSGNIVKEEQTYSDRDGRISEGGFRIPTDAIPGKWVVKATSGSNFDTTELNVTAVQQEGMVVYVEEGQNYPGVGNSINIIILGASQTVEIDIVSSDGEIVQKLSFPASDEGEVKQPWIVPKGTAAGTYTVKASDALDSAETTFEIS